MVFICNSQGAVINSRQFPFRFFSAYQVLKELASAYQDNRKLKNRVLNKGKFDDLLLGIKPNDFLVVYLWKQRKVESTIGDGILYAILF